MKNSFFLCEFSFALVPSQNKNVLSSNMDSDSCDLEILHLKFLKYFFLTKKNSYFKIIHKISSFITNVNFMLEKN